MNKEIFGVFIRKAKNSAHFLNAALQLVRYQFPAKKMTVVGITGTDGKTTTSHLVYAILRKANKSAALISTVAAYFGKKKLATGLHTTTPNPGKLQKLISKMGQQKIDHLVLETTSHALDQHRVMGCNFSIGVLTNITHEHLDYHQTFENYQKAKGKLFKKVKNAVLNKDDSSYAFVKSITNPQAKTLSYSIKKRADFQITSSQLEGSQTKFKLVNNKKTFFFKTNLIGDYNLSNILAAITVARILKIDWQTIEKAVASFKNVEGRMETANLGQPFTAMVDFAHTPNALKRVLTTLKKVKNKKAKLIVVFGCAGERDQSKRPMMAKIATDLADLAIFTAEDPRTENLEKIIDQMVKGVGKKRNFQREPDRKKAIELAVKMAKKGDIVVVCGKGHEESLCFGKKEIPWSDKVELEKAIGKR